MLRLVAKSPPSSLRKEHLAAVEAAQPPESGLERGNHGGWGDEGSFDVRRHAQLCCEKRRAAGDHGTMSTPLNPHFTLR